MGEELKEFDPVPVRRLQDHRSHPRAAEPDYPIERRSHVDARPDGSFVVAWVAHHKGNPHGEARAYDANGQKVGAGGVIMMAHRAGYQGAVRVAVHPSRDEFLVAHDWAYSGAELRIGRFDNQPRQIGGPVTVSDVVASDFSIDISDTGQVVACWIVSGTGIELYCQLFDYDTLTPLGDRFAGPGGLASDQSNPRVAWMPDGSFVTAWTDSHADGNGTSVKARSFNGDGEPRDPRRLANRTWTGDQTLGFLVPVGLNRVWLGWTDTGDQSRGARVRYRVLQRF